MNRRSIKRLAFALLCALGLGAVVVGFVADPFVGVPFQDYDQMPQEQRQAYEARSERMQALRWLGGVVIIATGIGTAVVALVEPFCCPDPETTYTINDAPPPPPTE